MHGFAQEKLTCADLHIGKFKIVDSIHNAITLIERNDTTETEYVRRTGAAAAHDHPFTLLFHIRWVDSCTYELKLIKSWYHVSKGELKLPPSKRMIVNKILGTGKKAYIIQTYINDRTHANFLQRVIKVDD